MIRHYMNILEQASFPSDSIQYYMEEGCGIFAYALWLYFDKPNNKIGIISNPYGEKWSRSIPFEVTHAFLIHDNMGMDVKGLRSIEDICKDFDAEPNSAYHPDDFRKKLMGNSDSKPLYGGQQEIREALKLIREFPDHFKLA